MEYVQIEFKWEVSAEGLDGFHLLHRVSLKTNPCVGVDTRQEKRRAITTFQKQ